MVAKLRAAEIRAELYLGNRAIFGNQLKYADKRNAPCVVIQGSDEKAKGEVTIKDLIVGAESPSWKRTGTSICRNRPRRNAPCPKPNWWRRSVISSPGTDFLKQTSANASPEH